MDNLRLILVFTLVFLGLMLWQAWNEDYGPQSQQTAQATTQSTADTDGSVPSVASTSPAGVPASASASAPVGAAITGEAQAPASESMVTVTTDRYRFEINTQGGTVQAVYLNDYPDTLKDKSVKFQLLRPQVPNLFIAQSGLTGSEGRVPDHKKIYRAGQNSYQMAEGKDGMNVDLVWQGQDGVKVTKRFAFQRGSYLVKVSHMVENGSAQPLTVREYRQLIRTKAEDTSAANKVGYTYTGAAIYSPDLKFKKIAFDDIEEQKRYTEIAKDVTGGWVGMIQHYFFGAWIPPKDEADTFYSNLLPQGRYVIGAYTPAVELAKGQSHTFESGFIAGPKLQEELAEIAPGLDLTVDYGWLTVLAQPIFWLMKRIFEFVGNWGWSIILLTIIIKLVFYKLSETSYKSMANMRKMTPRIQALKDRYGDDKQRMNQAMMELYKKEKINPLGGCLPILVQIPVFIALYWVLLENVEMRQAPFVLWIQDLSVKDPYFVLPVLMGVSMFVQQKLNPAPPDPMQAKLMMALPFVFTFFFAFFPAGLVLYWVVNNLLSISQQWVITRRIEQASK